MDEIDKHIWIKIFLQLHPKHNKILRQVCRKFYQVTNTSVFLQKQMQTNVSSQLKPAEIQVMPLSAFAESYQDLIEQRRSLFQNGCSAPPHDIPVINHNAPQPYNHDRE